MVHVLMHIYSNKDVFCLRNEMFGRKSSPVYKEVQYTHPSLMLSCLNNAVYFTAFDPKNLCIILL